MKRLVGCAFTALVVFSGGCHAKFKREVGSLGAVRAQTIVTGQPDVELGKIYDDSLAAAVFNVVQEVRSASPAMRIASAVKIEQVNDAMKGGFAEVLGDGPPFAYTEDKSAPTLQMEVLSWGLYVPYIGAPGEFTYDLRVQLYKPDGDRIYKTRIHCTTTAGAPPTESLIFGTVNNVKQLEQMSDAQIQDAFDAVARWCGGQLVSKMRRHAG